MQTDLFSDDELAAWLAFDQISCKGLGPKKVQALYDYFQSLNLAWQADKSELREIVELSPDVINLFIEKRQQVSPKGLLEKCRDAKVKVYPIAHPNYPARLKEIHDPPLILYTRGAFLAADASRAVGVVGTRRPTSYGQRVAKDIARELAQVGATIVSGMAVGIDSFAHRAAIDGGGKTWAVLGCGADVCYPSSNRPLYQMLTEGGYGAVISEFFPGTKPDTWRFPARNRIISGLSEALVVVEAGEESGSLITAHQAFEQSRDVFAVPGRIDNPMSVGTNRLIQKTTAQLYMSCESFMKSMEWAVSNERNVATLVELYGQEKDLYELLSREPIHFDTLCHQAGMTTGELSATLTMLELSGVVTRHPGDWYSRTY